MHKIMLDTNTFDFIYEKNLHKEMEKAVAQEKIVCYITQVQFNEIQKIKNKEKLEYILNAIESIPITKILTTVAIVGIDESKHGFKGSGIGHATIGSDKSTSLLGKLKSKNSKNPLSNNADLVILQTCIDNELDFLTSNDEKLHKNFEKMKKTNKLQIIENQKLYDLM